MFPPLVLLGALSLAIGDSSSLRFLGERGDAAMFRRVFVVSARARFIGVRERVAAGMAVVKFVAIQRAWVEGLLLTADRDDVNQFTREPLRVTARRITSRDSGSKFFRP